MRANLILFENVVRLRLAVSSLNFSIFYTVYQFYYSLRHVSNLVIILSLVMASSCAPRSAPEVATQRSETVANAQMARESEALHNFLVGSLALQENDLGLASKNLASSEKLIQGPVPAIHRTLAEVYLKLDKPQEALAEANQALSENPDHLEGLILKGAVLEVLKDTSEAEVTYRKIIRKYPQENKGYLLLSNLLSGQSKFDESAEVLNTLVHVKPQETLPLAYLGYVYELKGDDNSAEKYYQKSFELDPENDFVISNLLRFLSKANASEKIKVLSKQVLAKNPENVLVRKLLAQTYWNEGSDQAALEHLEFLKSMGDESLDTIFRLALIRIRLQDFNEAEKLLSKALDKTPEFARAYYYLAVAYASQDKKPEALVALRKIPKDDQFYVRARLFTAFIENDLKNRDVAQSIISEVLSSKNIEEELDPSLVQFVVTLCKDLNRLEDAKRILDLLVQKNPNNEKLLLSYAGILHETADDKTALEMMQRVIDINPENPVALNYAAYTLAENGHSIEQAYKLIKRALKIAPNDPYYLDTLAWIYFKQNKIKEAHKILKGVVTRKSDDVVILEHYADVQLKLNMQSEAAENYEKALARGEQSTNSEDRQAVERIREKLKKLR